MSKEAKKSEEEKEPEFEKMTNRETEQLLIEAKVLSPLNGHAFTMAIADAIEFLQKEHKRLKVKKKSSEEHEVFQKANQELYQEYSLKDDAGEALFRVEQQPSGQMGTFFDLDEELEDDRKEAVITLRKKYKKVIDEQKVKDDQYLEDMKEFSTFEPVKWTEKQLPKAINVEQRLVCGILFKLKKK